MRVGKDKMSVVKKKRVKSLMDMNINFAKDK
jgi:hypothetical protein